MSVVSESTPVEIIMNLIRMDECKTRTDAHKVVLNHYLGKTFKEVAKEIESCNPGARNAVERVLYFHSLKKRHAIVTSEMVDRAIADASSPQLGDNLRCAFLVHEIDAEEEKFQTGMTSHRILATHLASTFMRLCRHPVVTSLSTLEHQV